MSNIRFILFDAANTLIHKPDLWDRMLAALAKHGHQVDPHELKFKHKLVSELIHFPDNTSSDFYRTFNAELLYALGIIPHDELLNHVFAACTYLPWRAFEDTAGLKELPLEKGILSNFNTTLAGKINDMFGGVFSKIITSEEMKCAKPSMEFYRGAAALLPYKPEEILYIGDSLKLDMEPAVKLGMTAYLIDRSNVYSNFPNRLSSLEQIKELL